MAITVKTDEKVLVLADAQQVSDARAAGRAEILRLMRYDPMTDTLRITVREAAAAGLPVDLIRARG